MELDYIMLVLPSVPPSMKQYKEKIFSLKNKKDLGMACCTPPYELRGINQSACLLQGFVAS